MTHSRPAISCGSLGVSGRFDAPEFRDAFAHPERVILGAGIPLGAAALTREQTRALLDRGHRLPVHGFDVLMLAAWCGRPRSCEEVPEIHQAGPGPAENRATQAGGAAIHGLTPYVVPTSIHA